MKTFVRQTRKKKDYLFEDRSWWPHGIRRGYEAACFAGTVGSNTAEGMDVSFFFF